MNLIHAKLKHFLWIILCAFQFSAIAVVPTELWNVVKPFFLPSGHPIQEGLNELFARKSVLDSIKKMEEAGFTIINADGLTVAKHPLLPGYVVKFYLNTYDLKPLFDNLKLTGTCISELNFWLMRVEGAERIQKILDKYQYNLVMKVPKMWIYPLPLSHSAAPFPQDYIFIEEDMDIVDNETNEKMYREAMTPFLLRALYTVLKESGFYDSVYIDNNPFSKDGRIAFIDTEDFDRKPVPFEMLTPHFSPDMQLLWNEWITSDQAKRVSTKCNQDAL